MLEEQSSQGSIPPDDRLMQQPAWLVLELRTPGTVCALGAALLWQGCDKQGQVT